MTRLPLRDAGMAIAVAAIWGMGFVVAKGAITGFPPILLMALRFAITAFALIWFVPIPRTNWPRLAAVSVIGAAIQYSLTFSGLKGLDVGLAAMIVQLEVPFLILLGALILGERPSTRKWIGIGVAFCGVGLIAGQMQFAGQWLPLVLVVGGAFTWALGQVITRGIEGMSGLAVTAWVAMLATPQLCIMSLLFETGQSEALAAAGPKVWLAAAYLGLVMTALGYYLWTTLLLRNEVGRIAPFLLLLPIFSTLGGILFLGEVITLAPFLGGIIILSGVALITLEPLPAAARGSRPV